MLRGRSAMPRRGTTVTDRPTPAGAGMPPVGPATCARAAAPPRGPAPPGGGRALTSVIDFAAHPRAATAPSAAWDATAVTSGGPRRLRTYFASCQTTVVNCAGRIRDAFGATAKIRSRREPEGTPPAPPRDLHAKKPRFARRLQYVDSRSSHRRTECGQPVKSPLDREQLRAPTV